MDSLEELLGRHYRPPVMIKTVLLPFKGQIIYDGLVQELLRYGLLSADSMVPASTSILDAPTLTRISSLWP